MVEPLCVGAGIAGALAAAASICAILTGVNKNTQDSPRQAAQLLDEVHGTAASLTGLQSLLLDEEALDHLLARLLPVESVLAVVTGCVSTLSQLQEVVDYLDQGDSLAVDRAKWVAREVTIGAIIIRLQTHQSSLFLTVVGILNGYLPPLPFYPWFPRKQASKSPVFSIGEVRVIAQK